ncbi:hypothetical protein Cgig2_008574 [Carnegiea gigantea]|uniref:threonine--tRNA ligase n=1 Tax=Carnegiea gigantea TaxID=171969 RepID=A0A9Q1GUF8_9CARY|nr:hypothetical protein Cgig2_008574 [Carnegiea gigantea]
MPGEAKPNPPAAVAHPKDEAYLATVIPKRISLFESIKAQQHALHLANPANPIRITLPDGNVKDGKKWVTTPLDIAVQISKSLASNALIAEVNGVLWDMSRPLEEDCDMKIYTFEHDKGRDTFWHSSAHILGQSLEMEYGCKLCIGPCTTRGEGFYYDAFYGELSLNEDHFKQIEAGAAKAAAVEIINDLPEDKTITVYRCGPLVDLCRGPHIPNTSFVKAFCCLKASSAYWRGDRNRESLQRVYGISYPDSKRLKVVSPNIYNMQLWETSGHAANYKENMFVFEIEKQEFGLKPMNCPGHCLMFEHRVRSYRELPLRFADFGVLHRNEASGALTGLTRVRRFQQVKDEVRGALDFINYVYGIFGFTFDLKLSTRPEKYLGDIETWEKAEAALTEALNEFGQPWQINEGDGAFYGPKIDISVSDALKRKFQCATLQVCSFCVNIFSHKNCGIAKELSDVKITLAVAVELSDVSNIYLQLDFQLPLRFNLSYSAEDEAKRERPVIIHRAILEKSSAYALEVLDGVLFLRGQWHCFGASSESLSCAQDARGVREAQMSQYNYILVVGEKDAENKVVTVRVRDKADHSPMTMEDLLKHFREEVEAFH